MYAEKENCHTLDASLPETTGSFDATNVFYCLFFLPFFFVVAIQRCPIWSFFTFSRVFHKTC
jgi:hypothetical protein